MELNWKMKSKDLVAEQTTPMGFGAVFLASFFAFAAAALGGTVTLSPLADSEMRQLSPDSNFGSATAMVSGQVGSGGHFEVRRALLRFDLRGQIPVGAIVNSAALQISAVLMLPLNPVNSDFGVHRLLEDWDESNVTWNSRLAGVAWSAPGASGTADSVPNPSATVFVTGLGNYTFSATANLISDVQAWLDDPTINFGWLLLSEEGGPYTARHFATREDIMGNAPVLTIDFSLPPPSILTQPKSQTVLVGSTVSFSVVASSAPPLLYQWQSNGVAISGATNDTLVLNNVQLAAAGQYTVTVSNENGSTNSQPATLVVLPLQSGVPFAILTDPTNGSIFPAGASVPVSAQAFESNGAIAQVEFFLGTNSLGAVTNSPYSLVLSNLAAGSYSLTAIATDTNQSSATSAPVSFSVLSSNVFSVTIVNPTNGARFPAHSSVSLTAEATGSVSQVEFFLGTNSAGVVPSF